MPNRKSQLYSLRTIFPLTARRGEGRVRGPLNIDINENPHPNPLPKGRGNIKSVHLVLVSIFMLVGVIGLAVSAPHAFPVPFVAKQHTNIVFTDLPGTGSIKIFTVAGEEVASLPISLGENLKQWNVTNNSGETLATGVYLYIIEAGGETTTGKLIVIR